MTARRRGFSLIEALIVLAVAGAALMLIFSVGIRSTEIAFRLGRRALDVADRQLASDALREVTRGLSISPTRPEAFAKPPPLVGEMVGEARGFSGPAVLAAATPCAGSGPVGRVTITVVGDASGDVVRCQADNGPTAQLLDLHPHRARFSYSDDGLRWRDSWRETSGLTAGVQDSHERSVYIRLATDDGRIEIVERATSGRPDLQPAAPNATAPPGGAPQL